MSNGNGVIMVPEPNEVLDTWVGFRYSTALLEEIDQMAKADDRDRSYMIRKLIKIGKAHYLKIKNISA